MFAIIIYYYIELSINKKRKINRKICENLLSKKNIAILCKYTTLNDNRLTHGSVFQTSSHLISVIINNERSLYIEVLNRD